MLKFLVNSLDGVDDSVKGLYKQTEDGYQLQVDLDGSGYEQVGGLKSALAKVKEDRNSLRERVDVLSKFESLLDIEGFDPSNVQELMAKAANSKDPEAVEKLQRQFDKQLDAMKAQLSQAQQEAEAQKQKTTDYIIKTELMSNAPKAGINGEAVDDAYQLAKGQFRVDESGQVVHVDKDGDPTGKSPMDFFKQDFKEAKPWLYKAEIKKGSGTQPSNGDFNKGRELSATEKIAQGLSGS